MRGPREEPAGSLSTQVAELDRSTEPLVDTGAAVKWRSAVVSVARSKAAPTAGAESTMAVSESEAALTRLAQL